MKNEASICFSFDLDWAPEPLLDELGQLLDTYRLRATIFCTHKSPAVERLVARPCCETGIHPNFVGASQPEQAVIAELTALFPSAHGVRNHRLYYHSGLLGLLRRAGLTYLSNDLQFLQPGLAAHYDWGGLARLPIYWEDDVHCLYFDDNFTLDALALDTPGLKVLSFHPVHLWLNTRDMAGYEQVKAQVKRGEQLERLRLAGRGIRTLFEQVARQASAFPLVTLGELAARLQSAAPYRGQLRVGDGHGG